MAKASLGVRNVRPPVGVQFWSVTCDQSWPPSVVRIITEPAPAGWASGSMTPIPSVGLAKTKCRTPQDWASEAVMRGVMAVQVMPALVVRKRSGRLVELVLDDVSN